MLTIGGNFECCASTSSSAVFSDVHDNLNLRC